VREKAEDYDQSVITGVFIRVYLAGRQESRENELPLSSDEIASKICQLMEAGIGDGEPREVKSMVRKSPYPDHIPAIKSKIKERRPFIVADTETVLINNEHMPYAAGFLVVKPDEDVGAKPDYSIE